jgi:hypothetical protein
MKAYGNPSFESMVFFPFMNQKDLMMILLSNDG